MEVFYPNSNRIGQFNLLSETLSDDRERTWIQALMALCVVERSYPDESGRGRTFIAASELFQPLTEGEEIPEYRIECELARPFTPEENARARQSGRFKFYAVRKIIVRVPPVQTGARPHQTTVH